MKAMAGFELVEHGSDLRVRARGSDLASTLRNLLLGIMELAVDGEGVKGETVVEFCVEGSDCERMVVRTVNEMIYLMDAERMVFRDAEVDVYHQSDGAVSARVRLYGEKVDRQRHALRVQLKGATYGGLVVTPCLMEVTVDV